MSSNSSSTTPGVSSALPDSVKIVVGITTIPDRLTKGLLQKSIESLLKQDCLRNILAIVVNIPAQTLKGEAYDKNAAVALKSLHPKVVVNYGIPDSGPITKLLPTLEFVDRTYGAAANDIWISLADDDSVYTSNNLSTLLLQTQLQDQAVGFAGRSTFMIIYHYGVENRMEVDFLETFAGVVYKRSTFGPLQTFIDWTKTLPVDTVFVDDIVIGAWMNKSQVKMFVLPLSLKTQGAIAASVQHDANGTTELRTNNLFARNIQVLRKLQELGYFPNLAPQGPIGMIASGTVDFVYGSLHNAQNTFGAIGHWFQNLKPPNGQ